MAHEGALNVAGLVRESVEALLQRSGKGVPVLTDDLRLDELGLTSLDVTTLVVELTERLGPSGPGAEATEIEIATVGDLRRVFTSGPRANADDVGDPVAAARRRAEARRTTGR